MIKASFLRSRWFEDIPVGEFHVFGSYTLSEQEMVDFGTCLLYTSPSPRDRTRSRMPSSA